MEQEDSNAFNDVGSPLMPNGKVKKLQRNPFRKDFFIWQKIIMAYSLMVFALLE